MWIRGGLVCLVVGCSGKSNDSAGSGAAVEAGPYINVLSPISGQFLDVGDEVRLEAEGRLGDHRSAELTEVVWTSDDGLYQVEGNGLLVDDLHAGLYALEVQGLIEGQPVTASVDVVVYAR